MCCYQYSITEDVFSPQFKSLIICVFQTPLKVVKLHGSSTLVCVLEPNPAIVLCERGFSCLCCH